MAALSDVVWTQAPDERPRPASRALAYAVLAVTIGLAVVPGLLRPYPRFAHDSHMHASFTRAVNLTYCKSVYVSNRFDITNELIEHPDALARPVPEIIDRVAGSLDAYCRSLAVARVDNENSLMWLMRVILRVNPGITMAGIGQTSSALRIGILVLLCVALSRAGASLMMTAGVAICTCAVLRSLAPFQYNNNPYILMLPLLLIAVYVLFLEAGYRRPAIVGAMFASIGLLTAFASNMRTSQTPIYVAMFALFLVAWRAPLRSKGPSIRPRVEVAAVLIVALAYAAGLFALVAPMKTPGAEGSARHLIAHPLVLALAYPESDFSRREGLKWNDMTGLEIARRVDPQAAYLSAAYESALARYYLHLWRTHPGDMLRVYALKFRVAGSGVVAHAADSLAQLGLPLRVSGWLARRELSGGVWLVLTLGTAVVGWVIHRRTGSVVAFAWALISVAAAGTLLESALVMPQFYVFYHGVLLLYVLLFPVMIGQLLADWWRAAHPGVRSA